MRVAENLSLMGYPVSWCVHALSLAESRAQVNNFPSILFRFLLLCQTENTEDSALNSATELDSEALSNKKLGPEVSCFFIILLF